MLNTPVDLKSSLAENVRNSQSVQWSFECYVCKVDYICVPLSCLVCGVVMNELFTFF